MVVVSIPSSTVYLHNQNGSAWTYRPKTKAWNVYADRGNVQSGKKQISTGNCTEQG